MRLGCDFYGLDTKWENIQCGTQNETMAKLRGANEKSRLPLNFHQIPEKCIRAKLKQKLVNKLGWNQLKVYSQ